MSASTVAVPAGDTTMTNSRGVHWNESNLEQNESEKSATMKIDEPPTPFNFEYCQDDDEDEEPSEGANPAPSNPPAIPPAATISFADQWEKAGMTEVLHNPANLIPAVQQYEISEEERAEARKKFDENRKKHYNMRAVLASHADEEEEGMDGKVGGEEKEEESSVPLKRKSDEVEVKD